MAKRCEVVYEGRVQGVGFRATTRFIAGRHPVTGWVRNEPDGSVRLVAEGEAAAVEAFLDDLRTQMSRYIERERPTWSDARDEFDGFSIRH
ncbi:MAG: acylphosphatase [Phycisphaerales bacterium]